MLRLSCFGVATVWQLLLRLFRFGVATVSQLLLRLCYFGVATVWSHLLRLFCFGVATVWSHLSRLSFFGRRNGLVTFLAHVLCARCGDTQNAILFFAIIFRHVGDQSWCDVTRSPCPSVMLSSFLCRRSSKTILLCNHGMQRALTKKQIRCHCKEGIVAVMQNIALRDCKLTISCAVAERLLCFCSSLSEHRLADLDAVFNAKCVTADSDANCVRVLGQLQWSVAILLRHRCHETTSPLQGPQRIA